MAVAAESQPTHKPPMVPQLPMPCVLCPKGRKVIDIIKCNGNRCSQGKSPTFFLDEEFGHDKVLGGILWDNSFLGLYINPVFTFLNFIAFFTKPFGHNTFCRLRGYPIEEHNTERCESL